MAIELMQRHGYESVSVDAIVEAAGIGRTTFFRYFGTKPGVIWCAFDETIVWLEAELRAAPAEADGDADAGVMGAVRAAVVSSTRSAVFSSDVWLERFHILDTSPSLYIGAYEHWERWKRVIAEYLARHAGGSPGDALPMAAAGACQGVFIAELRDWINSDAGRDAFLERLDQNLARVTTVLAELFHPTGSGTGATGRRA
ncbi:TetR family transcriptional regulator [Streptomyces sp. JV176]|uniref:acyl-CoA-like ligand-binding transcription factor n=1 Tax=Streptomyces sp. JV176 TaxID=858630 RepID=UPI002E76302F|nr:TetR family transcriptional regulator [Streptomyces sp. JV176]MEE1804556.1 TetR family transcriptional regulator [Streptomyces sp. JV176]